MKLWKQRRVLLWIMGPLLVSLLLAWPRGQRISDAETALKVSRKQATRVLLAGSWSDGFRRWKELAFPPNPAAERISPDSFKFINRNSSSDMTTFFSHPFLGSPEAVLDCKEPMWGVTPRHDGLSGTGNFYIFRESDGALLLGSFHRGE